MTVWLIGTIHEKVGLIRYATEILAELYESCIMNMIRLAYAFMAS